MNNAKQYDLFLLIQAIRDFFNEKDFLDVLTPPMVENPGMEAHIHPFQVKSTYQKKNFNSDELYLHTSPEFFMKELLSKGHENIFTISYCFRDEPKSETHRPQFIMLEWYRRNKFYTQIMDDCESLISYCSSYLEQRGIDVKKNLQSSKLKKSTVDELFRSHLGFSILEYLNAQKLKQYIQETFPELLKADDKELWPWEDYFFLLFLNKIEPQLQEHPIHLVYNYPAPLAALSTLNKEDPRVCDRFEVYIEGVEVANCFNELTEYETQQSRFQEESLKKKALYGYELPTPQRFLKTLKNGYPESCGIALGVERLLMSLTHSKDAFFD
tara:strand:- start:88173 stop:89153 length:981 start_codon:yes stop_codon:yes gene_type:complete